MWYPVLLCTFQRLRATTLPLLLPWGRLQSPHPVHIQCYSASPKRALCPDVSLWQFNWIGPYWVLVGGKGFNFSPVQIQKEAKQLPGPLVSLARPGDNGARYRLEVECHGQHSVQSRSQLSLLVINSKAEAHAALGLGDMQAHTLVSFMGRIGGRLPGAISAHVALIETQSLFYTLGRWHFADDHAESSTESCSGIYRAGL